MTLDEYKEARAHTRRVADFEVSVGYDMLQAVELILRDAYSRYDSINLKANHENRKLLSDFIASARRSFGLAGKIDEIREDIYDDDYSAVERRRAEANELVRLILLYCDRTATSSENYVNIFNHMIEMPDGANIIDQKDFDRFDFKPR